MGVGVGGEGPGECFKPQSYSHFPKRSMIERRFSDQYKFEIHSRIHVATDIVSITPTSI